MDSTIQRPTRNFIGQLFHVVWKEIEGAIMKLKIGHFDAERLRTFARFPIRTGAWFGILANDAQDIVG